MKRTPLAWLLLALWIAALAILGLFVQSRLVIGTDLRLFLPSPTTAPQRLLLEEIGEGPASRLLAVALEGAAPETLADVSRELVRALQADERFRFVTNGELSLDAVPESLLPYRYLLSPTLDAGTLDAATLHQALQARARDLSSPAGTLLESWLPHDPTLELLAVVERWQPMQEPRREFDVWFDRSGERALLIAETRAAAFDPDRQRAAIQAMHRAFQDILADRSRGAADTDVPGVSNDPDTWRGPNSSEGPGNPVDPDMPSDPSASSNLGASNDMPPSNNAGTLKMSVSGAGQFSVLMEERTRAEAESLGSFATAGMILLLLLAYRRVGSVLLSALPLVSAGLAGLASVSAIFGTVHGITLAFGFTLIGVAQDYPLHLLSHRRAGRHPVLIARVLWPALATGVASTCIAYFTFLFSGVVGLAQVACFTIAGLAVAGFSTRYGLPALMDANGPDHGASPFLKRLWNGIAALPRLRIAAAVLALVCVGVILLAPQRTWENDLGKLTPVPADLLRQDNQLRQELGTPDVRYLLVVDAPDEQRALARLESLDPLLQALVADGAVSGYDDAARYLPSIDTQLQCQRALPDTPRLRSALKTALQGTPFRADAFEPFLADVAQARQLVPLTPEHLAATPLGASVEALLSRRGGHATALVTFSGVRNVDALKALADTAGSDVTLLDVKQASETLVAGQRVRLLWSLAAAAVLLIAVVHVSLRRWQRVVRVLAPMALTTLVILAALLGAGLSLTLFHLIALILAAGLGLDYALFFEHASHDRAEQRRTLHAVIVCSLSTLMVFALLATSSLPVLQAIGITVTLGVVSNFILALLLTRPARQVEEA